MHFSLVSVEQAYGLLLASITSRLLILSLYNPSQLRRPSNPLRISRPLRLSLFRGVLCRMRTPSRA